MPLDSIANAAKKPLNPFLMGLMAAHLVDPDLEEHSAYGVGHPKE
jgi:hypothetical protein